MGVPLVNRVPKLQNLPTLPELQEDWKEGLERSAGEERWAVGRRKIVRHLKRQSIEVCLPQIDWRDAVSLSLWKTSCRIVGCGDGQFPVQTVTQLKCSFRNQGKDSLQGPWRSSDTHHSSVVNSTYLLVKTKGRTQSRLSIIFRGWIFPEDIGTWMNGPNKEYHPHKAGIASNTSPFSWLRRS